MAKPSAKDLEALWEASEGILQLEKQYRSLKARLESVGEKLQEAREEVKPIIEKLGEDRFGLLGEATNLAKAIIGEAGEDGSRGRRSEIQPAILEALAQAEEGMTNADLQAAVSDRLGRQVNPGSLNQALQALLKNKGIRRTGKRRSFLYWSVSDGEAVIRPGEKMDKDAQAKLAELRDEDEDNDEEEEDDE